MSLKIKNSKGEWIVDQKAVQTSLIDLEGNFKSKNVEGALRELAEKTNEAPDLSYIENKVEANKQGIAYANSKISKLEEDVEYLKENGGGGGEVEGLSAVIEDVAKNKADISDLKTNLAKEITDREAADTALDGRLKTVEDLVNGDRGIEAIQTDLSQNKEDVVENAEAIQVCETNITKNSNAIALETTNRAQAIEVVTGKVTQESERALAAETVLDGKISQANTEIETAKGDITKNADAIVQETSNRAQAVSALDTKLNNMTPVASSSQPVGKSEGHIWIEILD